MADIEAIVARLGECAEKHDFDGAFALVKDNRHELAKNLSGAGVKDALKKTTVDPNIIIVLSELEPLKIVNHYISTPVTYIILYI